MIDLAAEARRYGYRITLRQVGPSGWRSLAPADRSALLQALVVISLEEKDADLAKGLGADGEPLVRISEHTRLHRHSEMGPADPNAPALTPAYALSRTRALLVAEASPSGDGVDHWWAYDPHTGGPWGQILDYHRRGVGRLPVRDVIGCGPACLGRIRRRLAGWWRLYQKGMAPVLVRTPLAGPTPKRSPTVLTIQSGSRTHTIDLGPGVRIPPPIRSGLRRGTFGGFNSWDPSTGRLIGGPGAVVRRDR